jgi:spermidine synthase
MQYNGQLIYSETDAYGPVEVVDAPPLRSLYLGTPIQQSSMFLHDPYALEMEYTRLMTLNLLFQPQAKKFLFLGLGGGSLPKYFCKFLPDSQIDVIELSPKVIEAGRRFFHVPTDDSRFHVHCCDAYDFLAMDQHGDYDAIFIDLYGGHGPSSVISKQDFFFRCKERLKDQGILIWNMWTTGSGSHRNQALKNLGSSFGVNFLVLPNDESPNFVLIVFSEHHPKYTLDEIRNQAAKWKEITGTDYPVILSKLNYFKKLGPLFQDWG